MKFNFVTGRSPDLHKKPLISIKYGSTEGGTGHVGFICHKQPSMEKAIRDRISQMPKSELRSGAMVVSVRETQEYTEVQYTTATGAVHHLRAPFLVGADGKTGYVRKKYLEEKGVILERCEGSVP